MRVCACLARAGNPQKRFPLRNLFPNQIRCSHFPTVALARALFARAHQTATELFHFTRTECGIPERAILRFDRIEGLL
jgi:hypothetical protein